LCYELVEFLNQEIRANRRESDIIRASEEDVTNIIPVVLERGEQYFRELWLGLKDSDRRLLWRILQGDRVRVRRTTSSSKEYITKRGSALTASSNAKAEGIDVLPRPTIQTASAKAIAGKTNWLLGSVRTFLAFFPKREFPSKNQIKAWVSITYFIRSRPIDLSRNQAGSLNYQDKILNVVDV
jgi:hypothetical protein